MGFKTYTCPIAKKCGGCEWLAVPYPIQLDRKQAAMGELFSEIAEADGAVLERIGTVKTDRYERPIKDIRVRRIYPDRELNKPKEEEKPAE